MIARSSAFGSEMPDILLVEDNPLHVRLVKSMLADIWPEPNNLRTARKLESAIAELKATRPDCILLDRLLPDADGLEAVNAMLAVDNDVPVVVLSSHEDDDLALQAVREGAQDYLVKGTVGPDGLARSIRFVIHRHRLIQQGIAAIPPVGDLVSTGVAVLDADGVVSSAQTEVAQMLGMLAEDLAGTKIVELTHPNDVAMWNGALESAQADAAPEFSIRIRHAGGSDLSVRIELTPMIGIDGQSYLMHWYSLPPEGTASSGGQYAVVTEWA